MGHVDLGGTWHESSYRLVETYDVTVDPQWRIELDPQPYGEVVLVQSGCFRIELGDESAEIGPGGLGVLLPGRQRVTAAVGETPLRFIGFGFRIELFGAIELSGLLGLPIHIATPSDTVVALLRDAVRNGALASPAAALRARSHAELVTAELVESFGDVGHVRHVRARPEIEAALTMMERDLGEDLDIAGLAKAAHMSPKHFARCFKDVVGVPPIAYLQAMRLSRARSALARTDKPAVSVAADHGFADAAHFSRAFKRQYGQSPSDFRRQLRARDRRSANLPSDKVVALRNKDLRVAASDDGDLLREEQLP